MNDKDIQLVDELARFSETHKRDGLHRSADLFDRARIRIIDLSRWRSLPAPPDTREK